MNVTRNFMIALTSAACLSVLAMSVYPGVLSDLMFMSILLSPLIVPVVGLSTLSWYFILARRGRLGELRIPRTHNAIVITLLLGTSILLTLNVPRRIAFAVSRGSFEEMSRQATTTETGGQPLHRRLGVYTVDKFAADARGGIYFRVYKCSDGLGPDDLSYGVAYRPNNQGCPFGAKEYRVSCLDNDWYWFCASDDWY